jgi:hypothetical protein
MQLTNLIQTVTLAVSALKSLWTDRKHSENIRLLYKVQCDTPFSNIFIFDWNIRFDQTAY